MKKLLILVGLIALAGSVLAQDAMMGIVVKPDALTWKDSPALPKGAQFTTILGDPTKAEMVVQRFEFPRNYQIPPHTHPFVEVATVISGTFGTGEGEKLEKKGEGGFIVYAPGKTPTLRLDRERGGDRPNSVYRASRHRLHQPG
jgi:quercetin dioxygenase-like cupin family protein